MQIRIATPNDAEEILSIYSHYVLNTAVSFEYDVPTIEEFRQRISTTLQQYPYIVAVEDRAIVGYAYASAFHSRAAYKHSAELSIYIKESEHKKGIGRKLYSLIEEILLKQNVILVHACIAVPDGQDKHLTDDSEKFHIKMGFHISAKHELCGYKFGKWYSIIWMDKLLKERPSDPKPFIPFSDIKNDFYI